MNVPFDTARQKKKPEQVMPVKELRQPPLESIKPPVSQPPPVAFDGTGSSSEPLTTMFGPICSKISLNCWSTQIGSTGPPWLELAETITGMPVSVESVVSSPCWVK